MDAIRYRLDFEGVTPLVMNSNIGLLDGSAEEKRDSRDKAQWEKDHFRDLAYTIGDQLIIPARAVKKAMIKACSFLTEKPKGTNFKSFGPFVEAAIIIEDDALLGCGVDKLIPWTVIVNLDPSKGEKGPRGPRTRPMLALPWAGSTRLAVLDAILTEAIIEKIAQTAGMKCGFLDARRIDMGRASITVSKEKR